MKRPIELHNYLWGHRGKSKLAEGGLSSRSLSGAASSGESVPVGMVELQPPTDLQTQAVCLEK